MDLEEKTQKENLIFDGKILKVYNDEITLPDGRTARREYVRHPGGATILFVNDGCIAFVRQFRYALGCEILELPAGKLEISEDPKLCVIRELEEEIGFRVIDETRVETLGSFYPTVGYTNEVIYLFCLDNSCAKGDSFVNDNSCVEGDSFMKNGNVITPPTIQVEAKLDDGEFLNVEWYSLKRVYEMLDCGEIQDGKTIVALQRFRQKQCKKV